MSKAYGFIEITGVVAAINALDIMCKTADVELASWERRLGGRLVTLIVEGDVSAVNLSLIHIFWRLLWPYQKSYRWFRGHLR